MCQPCAEHLYAFFYLIFTTIYTVGTSMIPILEVRELKVREVK